jgi:PKD repeat protein
VLRIARRQPALLIAFLSLACGGSSSSPAGPTGPSSSNPATLSVSPTGGAIVGVTVVTFTALSPSGMSYQWDFGDGSSASGPTVTHTYSATNTFTAQLTASNGSTGQSLVDVASLSGSWADVENPGILQWTLTQSGSTISGTDTVSGASLQGTVSSPRHMVIQDGPLTLTGRLEAGLNAIDLTWSGPGGPQEARLIRQ